MPKLVTQLAQGNSFSLTSENGAGAYNATRSWKVILNAPNETFDIGQAIGVAVGDPYSQSNKIPCVSIEARADGESRLVRIITATYRATPGAAADAPDPKTQPPDIRPAMYSMSTSLTEIAAWGGRLVTGGVSGSWVPAVNPANDLIDGITRLEPVININIEQYSSSDMSNIMGYSGYVNGEAFTFSGMSIAPHCCMLQGVSSTPVVEQFGSTTFRGFKITLQFAVRAHYTITRQGPQAIGWDVAVPQTGFNIKNARLGDADVERSALVLEHQDNKIKANFVQANFGLSYAQGTENTKVRAMVTVPASEGSFVQRPSSQPVPLNDDGTPRASTATPPVWINRVCLQPEMPFGNNFSNFGVRLIG